MYVIKFALTCKTFISRSNSKTHSNRYKNNFVRKKILNEKFTAGNVFNISIYLFVKKSKCRSRRSHYQKYTTGEISFSPRYCI